MMRALRSLLAAGFAAILLTVPAMAQESSDMSHPGWSFSGPFGSFDLASAQRGFEIYSQVCSNCHSMTLLHYRDLSGIGFDPEQIKALLGNDCQTLYEAERRLLVRIPMRPPSCSAVR